MRKEDNFSSKAQISCLPESLVVVIVVTVAVDISVLVGTGLLLVSFSVLLGTISVVLSAFSVVNFSAVDEPSDIVVRIVVCSSGLNEFQPEKK